MAGSGIHACQLTSHISKYLSKLRKAHPWDIIVANGRQRCFVSTNNHNTARDGVDKGSVIEVSSVYQKFLDKDRTDWTWLKTVPEAESYPAEDMMTARSALLVQKRKSKDPRKNWEAHSLIVQSSILRDALRSIFKDYPGVSCDVARLSFDSPFAPFIHRWKNLIGYMDRNLDSTAREHLNLLSDFLSIEIGDTVKAVEDCEAYGVVTYTHLWSIFQPRSTIFTRNGKDTLLLELLETGYVKESRSGPFLRLKCELIDTDGEAFGRLKRNIDIPLFTGTRKIVSLPAYPLEFHQQKQALIETMTLRGEKFNVLRGNNFKQYTGTAYDWDNLNKKEVPVFCSGRVVIDAASFNRFQSHRSRKIINSANLDHDEEYWTDDEDTETLTPMTKETLQLSPTQHLICNNRVRGYSLNLRKWLDFNVEHIENIEWRQSAFESLVLPQDKKDLILAFTESQLAGQDKLEDLIQGKGNGIILLLSGPPGVGKTLSAEAVAEHLHVPLHTVSAGDLGSHPGEVELNLERIFSLATKWKAVLLLDECDVFLEARSPHEIERNRIVSMFLRTLEYYEGILFLTTNRCENIDPAFQSRIHVSIEYSALNAASRKQIWTNLLSSLKQGHMLTESDLKDFTSVDLNGRQIRNILKAAQLLALQKKEVLSRKFIDVLLGIEKKRPAMQRSVWDKKSAVGFS